MTGDGAVGSGVGDPEHAAASGPRSQNQSRLGDGHTHTYTESCTSWKRAEGWGGSVVVHETHEKCCHFLEEPAEMGSKVLLQRSDLFGIPEQRRVHQGKKRASVHVCTKLQPDFHHVEFGTCLLMCV